MSFCAKSWYVNANKLSWITQSNFLTDKINELVPASFCCFSCFASCFIYNFVFQAISEKKKERKKNCSKDFTVNFFLIISCHIPHSKFVLLNFKSTFLLARISCCNFFFLNHLENFWEGMGAHVLLLKNFFNVISILYGI